MKKAFIGLFLLLIACNSSNNKSINLFGIAEYSLDFHQRIVKNVPDNEIHRQVLSTYFKKEQLPIFRTIESGVNKVLLTIPTGLDFEEKELTQAPENCEILQTQQTEEVKYISYKCSDIYVAVYLRRFERNTFCVIISGKEQKSFEKEAEKVNIDKKIIVKE